VPVLLLRLNDPAPKRKPVAVLLHSSYKCKEWLRPLLEVNNRSHLKSAPSMSSTGCYYLLLFLREGCYYLLSCLHICRHMPPGVIFLLPSIRVIMVKGPATILLT
jgi:hypothetical protein